MAKLFGAQRMVLQAILDTPKDSAGYVEASQIAERTQIATKDVEDWLETLEGEGFIEVAQVSGDLIVLMTAKGRLQLGLHKTTPISQSQPDGSGVHLAEPSSPKEQSGIPKTLDRVRPSGSAGEVIGVRIPEVASPDVAAHLPSEESNTDALGATLSGADQYADRAESKLRNNDLDGAIDDYDKAISLDQNRKDAYYHRGIAWNQKKQYLKAIADFDKAIEIDPNYAPAYRNRGNAFSYINDFEKAITDYDQAIALNPDNALGYYNRSLAWARKKEHVKALKNYEKAVDLDQGLKSADYRAYLERAIDFQVVLLIHGIRTEADWGPMVKSRLEIPGKIEVIPIKYGYFDAFRFWLPFWTRNKPTERVYKEIRVALQKYRKIHPEARLSVIAHSFGTYIIGEILKRGFDLQFHRLILCGSVLRQDFPWEQYQGRFDDDKVVNECGKADIWPVLAQSASWGYGVSGTHGFGTVLVKDRFHAGGHGQYFNPEFAEQYWEPFIRRGEFEGTKYEVQLPPTPWWVSVLGILPLRWLLLTLSLTLAVASVFAVSPALGPMGAYLQTRDPAGPSPTFGSVTGSVSDRPIRLSDNGEEKRSGGVSDSGHESGGTGAVARPANDGEAFKATSRRLARTTASHARIEYYENVKALLNTLASETVMRHKISSSTPRIKEEDRNVAVRSNLVALRRRASSNYELVVADIIDGQLRNPFIAEVIGEVEDIDPLSIFTERARKDFKESLGGVSPAENNYRYKILNEPIRVEVTGSLYFNPFHRLGSQGPPSLRTETSWEIQPVLSLKVAN